MPPNNAPFPTPGRSRMSVFPETSNRLSLRPTKRMGFNDIPGQTPSAVGGELSVSPSLSQETRWSRMIHWDLRDKYRSDGAAFWPINPIVGAISRPPTEVSPGVYTADLFADTFIGKRVAEGPDGASHTVDVSLVSRTVLQPTGINRAMPHRLPQAETSEFYATNFCWILYWNPVDDLHVTVADPEPTNRYFRNMSGKTTWRAVPSAPFSIPFVLRKGAEDDVIILKKGTPLVTLTVTSQD